MKTNNGLSIRQIAELTGGEIVGDPEVIISRAATLENASSGDITFFSNPKYGKWLEKTKADCILVSKNIDIKLEKNLIRVESPDVAFSAILKALYGDRNHPVDAVSEKAVISSDVKIEEGVRIGEYTKIEKGVIIGENTIIYPDVYIGENTHIGSDCVILPKVVIMDNVRIGSRVILNPGSVIGSDGFGYSTVAGRHEKIPQVGNVIIEDDVEIGSNSCIDRGTPGNTVIGSGTKIDNLVQVAHNVRIGKNCFLCSQVGIAGSTVVEDNVFLAGQAGIVGHINIGEFTQVGAQAGVTRDIPSGQQVSGYPAMKHSQAKRINALIRNLPKMFKDLEKLKKKMPKEDE